MNKLTVYINTLPVNNRSGGIKTFLLELLLAFAHRNNEWIEYHLICSYKNVNLFRQFDNYSNIKRSTFPVNNVNPFKRIFFEQFKLHRLIKKTSSSVLLNICNIAVLNCPVPQVTIIQAQMSIAALRKTLPSKYNTINVFHKVYYDLLLNKSIKISRKVICVSYYMQQFIKDYTAKIEVIHEGVNLAENESSQFASKHIPETPYILSVSTLFPHKNMDKLIVAYAVLKRKYDLNYKLVIAGKDPDGKQLVKLKQIANNELVENDVILTNWVAPEEIASIYRNASLFVYISGMEFFGLPVLEAMAHQVPVIASNKMSVPEVVNDAGILTEPDDVNNIAEKMYLLLTNSSLRDELIKKGNNNIQQFKWDTTAAKFENVFKEVTIENSTLFTADTSQTALP